MRRWIFLGMLAPWILLAQNYVHDPFTTISEEEALLSNAFAGGLNNPQIWEVELNNDGIMDMLIFDRNGDKVLPFLNDGTSSGNLSYHPEYEQHFPAMEHFVVTADYNCDGLPDLFTAFDDGVKVFEAIPEAGFVSYIETIDKLTYKEAGFTFDVGVGIIDIPAFYDMNGDGDIDMLTFKLVGGFVDYFENQAVENGEDCGVLDLEHVNSCWGDFYESGVNKAVELDSNCSESPEERSGMHAGSTFLIFDENADGLMDLVLGDLSFQNLNKLINGGTTDEAYIVEQDTLFPSYDIPADMTTFPAPFLYDVNNDGKKDLLVSPNKEGFSINRKNIWYYENISMDDTYEFEFQTDSLIVSDMVDVGSESKPFFFDYDADGLLDMAIGNYGYFEEGSFIGRMALYQNVGTTEEPAFNLLTRNFADLEAYGFRSLHPTFGDLNGDGSIDMILGEENGWIHFFKNTTLGSGPANFVLTGPNFQGIDIGKFSAPQLVDVNGDLLLDLIIGEENGNLNYYENNGTETEPIYTLIDELWGGVDVRLPLTLTGYSTPWLSKDSDGEWQLLVGSLSGRIFEYTPTVDFAGLFTLETDFHAGIDEGDRVTVCLQDISNDGVSELLTGNDRGGIALYRNTNTVDAIESLGVLENVAIYPVPCEKYLNIVSGKSALGEILVLDLQGRILKSYQANGQKNITMEVDDLVSGIYLVVCYNEERKAQTVLRMLKY